MKKNIAILTMVTMGITTLSPLAFADQYGGGFVKTCDTCGGGSYNAKSREFGAVTGGRETEETQRLNQIMQGGSQQGQAPQQAQGATATKGQALQAGSAKAVTALPDRTAEMMKAREDKKKAEAAAAAEPGFFSKIGDFFSFNKSAGSTQEQTQQTQAQARTSTGRTARPQIVGLSDINVNATTSRLCDFIPFALNMQDVTELEQSVDLVARAKSVRREDLVAFSTISNSQHLIFSPKDKIPTLYAVSADGKVKEVVTQSTRFFDADTKNKFGDKQTSILFVFKDQNGQNSRAGIEGIDVGLAKAKSMPTKTILMPQDLVTEKEKAKDVGCDDPTWKVERLSSAQ